MREASTPPAGRPRRRPARVAGIERWLGPGLLLLAVALTVAGAALPWWTSTTTYYSTPPQVSGFSTYLQGYMRVWSNLGPGERICSFSGLTSNPQYLCPTLGTTDTLYMAAYALVLASIALLIVLLALVGAARWSPPGAGYRSRVLSSLPIVPGAMLLSACWMVAVGQESTFRHDTGPNNWAGLFEVDWTCHSSPLTTFAGTCNAIHISFQWGPALGWGATLVAGLCTLAATAVLYDLRGRGAVSRSAPPEGGRGSTRWPAPGAPEVIAGDPGALDTAPSR